MFWFSRKKRQERDARRWKESRMIYEFFDGKDFASADPVIVWRSLEDHPEFNIEQHPRLANAGDEEAAAVMLDAIRKAFGVKPLDRDGSGLTEEETFELFASFCEWMAEVKKNSPDSAILQPATAEMQSSFGEPTTKHGSDSG